MEWQSAPERMNDEKIQHESESITDESRRRTDGLGLTPMPNNSFAQQPLRRKNAH
jgi:hypothetical protein